MAPYGGPIEPGVAVGGFPKPNTGERPDFKLATGLILTFLINNEENKTMLEPALDWELKYRTYCMRIFSSLLFICIPFSDL